MKSTKEKTHNKKRKKRENSDDDDDDDDLILEDELKELDKEDEDAIDIAKVDNDPEHGRGSPPPTRGSPTDDHPTADAEASYALATAGDDDAAQIVSNLFDDDNFISLDF